MPELPEVETIRLGLQKYIVGKTIEGVEVRLPKILSGNPKDIIGARIKDVRRFGKGLVIDLDNGYSIAAHIKLTGQFVYRDSITAKLKLSPKVGSQIPNKFTHVIFRLSECHSERSEESRDPSSRKVGTQDDKRESYLYYNDIRQFGWIKIVKSDKLKEISFFKDLGPEPFKDLTFENFKNIITKSNLAIKPLIMDQKKMSGVGNIYANDALFEARIDPRRKANDLSEVEIKKLYNAILKVLKIGLEQGGATELNFVNALGQEGGYQNHFLVYGRENESCKVCGSKIQKIKLGGRGTYFCPKCQR